MKHLLRLMISLVLILGLVSCSQSANSATNETQDSYVSEYIDSSYEGALPVRNQLALGTLQLAGTPEALTSEQAATLLPLWQALRSTSKTGGTADAEVNALLEQIESSFTAEQLAAISKLQLTQADLQEWAKTNGVTTGTGGGQPGQGQGMSPEARATRQAEEGRTSSNSSGGVSSAIMDALIAYLEAY